MAQQSNRGVILCFHGIPKESSEEFHNLLQRLSKHFAIVPLETLIERVRRNRTERSTVLALTFDDGLRNHWTVAYPVLLDLRLPATFYVCPGLVERNITTWTWEFWCRIPWLSEADRREFCTQVGTGSSTDVGAILAWMKTIPLAMRLQVEDAIRLKTPEFAFTEAERGLYELMSWKELVGIDPGLINVGSHTMTHCDLPTLKSEELMDELEGSRAVLERRLGRLVHDFCYPDGMHNDCVMRAVANVYRSAMTTVGGGVSGGDSLHSLKRVGANLDLRWVSWLLATHTGRFLRC
jgi:peptidoglycan/xylan/chitin deacetylase (PgdA/CDA1 family)